MIIGRLGLGFVMAGKLNQEDYTHLAEVNEVKPCCGRNWWYRAPKIESNLLRRKNKIEILEISWLCFSFYIGWW